MVIIGRGAHHRPPPGRCSGHQAAGLQRRGHRGAHRGGRPGRHRARRPTWWWPPPAGPALVTPDMVKPGAAVVVGAGTSCARARSSSADVARDVAEVAGWITPRLGGVGPMTRAMLLSQRGGGGGGGQLSRERRARSGAAGGQWADERTYEERPVGELHRARRRRAATTRSSASWSTPGKRLSYQRHARRAEHWFVVSGTPGSTLDGTVIDLGPPATPSTSRSGRPTGSRTPARADVVFIEVQHGDVLRRGRHRPPGGRLRAGRQPGDCSPRDPDRRPAGRGPDLLLRVLPAQERRASWPPWPGPSTNCSRSSPRSSRSPTGAAPSRASAPSTS